MGNTREDLKRIATEEVQKNGIRALSFRKLGASVGVKSSSVIYHFNSKKELVRELAHDYMAFFFQKIETIDAKGTRAQHRLQAFVDIFQKTLESDRFCLCGMLASDLDEIDDSLRQDVQQFFRRMEDWAAAIVETDDRYNAHQARELAQVLVSGLEGALLMDRADSQPTRLSALRNWVAAVVS